MHFLPPMWNAHRLHHSDGLVDVTTSLRQHPIETAWRFLFIVGPSWALDLPPEAVAVYRVVSVLVGLTEHMNVEIWKPVDATLSLAVCTPNMHKVHHSRRAVETDSNYGNILSWFDRLLGTFTAPRAGASSDYGLDGFDDVATQRFGALLRLPFRERA